MRLFLFDIDGTLIWAHGAGRIALTKAMVAVYGTPPVYEDYDAHFRVGAFGSDDADRRRLPAIARARAQALTGHGIPYEQILVIGDTPLDVDCARACGARSVGVATGQHTYDELTSCSPDFLFADFSDVDGALRCLTR